MWVTYLSILDKYTFDVTSWLIKLYIVRKKLFICLFIYSLEIRLLEPSVLYQCRLILSHILTRMFGNPDRSVWTVPFCMIELKNHLYSIEILGGNEPSRARACQSSNSACLTFIKLELELDSAWFDLVFLSSRELGSAQGLFSKLELRSWYAIQARAWLRLNLFLWWANEK